MNSTEDRIERKKLYDMHEGIVFVIELSDTLIMINPETGVSHIEVILEAIQESMAHSVITLPNTGYGVYLFNGQKTTPGLKDGIERLFPLTDLNYKDMKIIQDILEEKDEPEENDQRPYIPLEERFPVALEQKNENPLDDVLRVVEDEFLTKKPFQTLYNNKKIFLFTDNDNPVDQNNVPQKNLLRNTINNLSESFINISPFFISTKTKPFNHQLYSEIVALGDEIFDGPRTKPIEVGNIKQMIIRRKEIKRKQLETAFIFSKELTIGVRGYAMYSHEEAKRQKLLFENENTRKNVYSKRRYIDESTGYEFERSTRVYEVANNQNFIHLNKEQIGELEKYDEEHETFIRLLGFKDAKSGIKLHYNSTKSAFLVPDEDSYEGSTRTLSALYSSLKEKDKVAIVFGKIRRASPPSFYALQPSKNVIFPKSGKTLKEKERETERDIIFPQGFFLIRLPNLDDIRQVPGGFEITREPSNQLKSLTVLILSKLKLWHGYQPKDTKNPTLQQHFRVLHDYLLQVEEKEDEDFREKVLKNDDTLRKNQVVRSLIENSELNSDDSNKLYQYISEWNELYSKNNLY